MKINSKYIAAVDVCLEHNIPFTLFALPGEERFSFFASLPDSNGESHAFDDKGKDTFFINFFDNDEPYIAGVVNRFDADSILEYITSHPNTVSPQPLIQPATYSTHRVSYDNAFASVIPRLKHSGGKVVLSQHQALISVRPLIQVAIDYFKQTNSTFRYLCFTPETGIWVGSTPELLMQSTEAGDGIVTMSLAGTKAVDDDTPWDEKNLEEHHLVTLFIEKSLKDMSLEVEVDPLSELTFCNIKHLCNVITATGQVDAQQVLSELSPTPAVAGFPREVALTEIDTFETHCRRCYAGYVGVRIGGEYHAFVNLRCAFVAPINYGEGLESLPAYLYNLYSGGGIVASSNCDDEWNEAISKIARLKAAISAEGYDELSNINPKLVKFTNRCPKIDLPF